MFSHARLFIDCVCDAIMRLIPGRGYDPIVRVPHSTACNSLRSFLVGIRGRVVGGYSAIEHILNVSSPVELGQELSREGRCILCGQFPYSSPMIEYIGRI